MPLDKKEKTSSKRKQLSRKDYDKLKQTAYEYVVVKGLDQKEVAGLLNISEPTMSKWSQEGRWREEREARQQCSYTNADNTRKLLQLMSKQRLELEESIHEAAKTGNTEAEIKYRGQASTLSDEISKINKTLTNLESKNYTLGVYIDVMDSIFSALRQYDEQLWQRTIDFQALHIRKTTIELG
jgi:transposase